MTPCVTTYHTQQASGQLDHKLSSASHTRLKACIFAAALGTTNDTVNDTMHTVPVRTRQGAPGCHGSLADALVMIAQQHSVLFACNTGAHTLCCNTEAASEKRYHGCLKFLTPLRSLLCIMCGARPSLQTRTTLTIVCSAQSLQ